MLQTRARVSACLLAGWLAAAPALALPDARKTPVVYRVAGMDEAKVSAGRTFARVGEEELRFDAYYPADATASKPLPAVVFVSGGQNVRAWEWYRSYGRLAAAHGFAGLVPDKRFAGGFEGTRSGYEDTVLFLQYLSEHAGEVGVDPNLVCLWVFSGGGRMASAAFRDEGPRVTCLAIYYGVLDVEPQIDPAAPSRASLLATYSPVHSLAAMATTPPPTLLVRAGKDSEEINSSIARFVQAGLEANLDLTFINDPEGDHGFDGFNDTERSREILQATFAFLARHLGGRPVAVETGARPSPSR